MAGGPPNVHEKPSGRKVKGLRERKPGDTGKGKAEVSVQSHDCVFGVPVPAPPGPLTGALSSFCTMDVSGASTLKSPSFNFHVTIFIGIAGAGCALPAARPRPVCSLGSRSVLSSWDTIHTLTTSLITLPTAPHVCPGPGRH